MPQWTCVPDYRQHLLSNSVNSAFTNGGIHRLFSLFPFVSLTHLVFSPSTILFVSLTPSASQLRMTPSQFPAFLSSSVSSCYSRSLSVCAWPHSVFLLTVYKNFIVTYQHYSKNTLNLKPSSWRLSLFKHPMCACGFKRGNPFYCNFGPTRSGHSCFIFNINTVLKKKNCWDHVTKETLRLDKLNMEEKGKANSEISQIETSITVYTPTSW